MGIPRAQAVTIKPTGLSDAVDGTNAFSGAMAILKDLIPNPTTRSQFVPRPASIQLSNFSGFDAAQQGEALLIVGTRAYGFIASDRFAGKSEPFCYDLVAGAFVPIANVTAANTPTSQPTTGDWTPPSMAAVTNSRIMMTHPGYDGVTYFVGWLDLSSFSSTDVTGDTHTSNLIDGLSTDVVTVNGWQVGYAISGAGIPADTFITSIAADGLSVTLSNPTTSSLSATALSVSGGSFAGPVYDAGQTSPIALASVPVFVSQFNGRAYYAVGNGATFSDPLAPTQVSGGGGTYVPTLFFGDDTPVTAFGGNPVTSQLSGGIVQSLIVFKGGGPYWQITGDPATMNLVSNEVAGTMGTRAPNTICTTPIGLAYVAQDGLRIIGTTGLASQPIGQYGQGVNVPFVQAINPSRMCAAYNHNIIRISVQNGAVNGQPWQEYWYDLGLQVWTGPHSFPASLIGAYDGVDDTFILFPQLAIGAGAYLLDSDGNVLFDSDGNPLTTSGMTYGLWQSDVFPTANSTYTENGNPMSFSYAPCLSPDNSQAAMNVIRDSMLGLALPSSSGVSIAALNEQGAALDTISLLGPKAGGSIWGAFDWGAATWEAPAPSYQQYYLPWHAPLVFKQISFLVSGASLADFVIGNSYFEYEKLGYPIV